MECKTGEYRDSPGPYSCFIASSESILIRDENCRDGPASEQSDSAGVFRSRHRQIRKEIPKSLEKADALCSLTAHTDSQS